MSGLRSVRQENVSIFKYPNMFCHCSTTSSELVHSIQFNEDIHAERCECVARCCHSTPPTLERDGTFLVIHTANGNAGFVLDVINNLRWKSKPDFWFSVFHLFSHIIDPCVRLCAGGLGVRCVRYRCIICQFADALHRVDAFT